MFNQYPYINLNDLNLDYILKAIKEMRNDVTNFVSINAIKYADPIQWNITSQYEKNTIVIDPQTGTAYISVAAVPAGVALTRPEYWTVVFDLGAFVTRAAKNFTVNYEEDTTLTATFSTTAGEWLIWGDTLYVAKVNITAGDSYVVDGNIERITVEEVKNNLIALIDSYYDAIMGVIGELADLTTSDADSIVDAINSIITERGALSDLNTTDKDSIVNAINSIITERGALSDLSTTDKTSIVNAINEVNSTGGGALALIGDLNNLTTTDKDNVVDAINEVNYKIDSLKSTIYVNVKDYGAVGDGVTDDTAAINAAKAVAESYDHGATLFFPAGDYLISSTITFNYVSGRDLFGVSILGEGKYQSIIFSNTDIDLISYVGDETLSDGDSHLFGIKISDIYLKYYGGSSTHAALSFTKCNLVLVDNVRIRYFKTGIYLSDCPNSTFFNVGISANVAGAHGFDIGDKSVSNSYISCFFAASGSASGLTSDSYGFYATRGSIADQTILYFDVGGNGTGAIFFNGVNTTAQQSGDVNIINLVCETYYGIQAYNMNRHGNMNIIGGWFNCTGERSGIYLTSCVGVNINNAIFVNNIGGGDVGNKTALTVVNSNCKHIKMSNCIIKNQTAVNANVTGQGFIFTDNIIEIESACSSANSLVGVNFKNAIISNNVFSGIALRYARLYSGSSYSLMTNNVADAQSTGTAFQNDGTNNVSDNNLNG